MKKTLLYVLIACLAMVFMVGCGEKKKSETPNTPISADNLATLKGNYEVQAFFNSTDLSSLTLPNMNFIYNCNELKTLDSGQVLDCDPAKDVQLASQAVISGDNASNMVLETKVQMAGGSFADIISQPGIGDIAKANAYNYTKYGSAAVYNDPVDPTLPPSFTPIASALGVSGRNMNSQTGDLDADVTFFLLSDGRIAVSSTMFVEIPNIGQVQTNTTVILKKINDTTPAVKPDELVNPNMPGFDASGFVRMVNFTNPDDLIGTYNIDTFWVDAVITQLTNNCDEAKTFISAEDEAKGCGEAYGNVTATAKATIEKDANGNYVFTSKMQMAGGIFDNASMMGVLGDILKPNQYNYTVYSPIPVSAITLTEVNTGATAVLGTTGRDAAVVTSDTGAQYNFILNGDGRLLNKMAKTNPMGGNPLSVYVLLKKTSDRVETLDANVKFETPAIPLFNDTPTQP